jgi:anion transporter
MMRLALRKPVFSPTITVTICLKTLSILLLCLFSAGAIWVGMAGQSSETRIVLITFVLAVIGWTLTDIEDTYIALLAVVVLALTTTATQQQIFVALGDPIIWLMLAAFLNAAAVTASGLSHRLAAAVAERARSVQGLFYLLTGVLMITALIIPATSGRAALMLPVFAALVKVMPNRRVVTALALLFPTIILLSAFASLIGAGGHLVTADILLRMSGERITYGWWLLLGAPFALVSCYLSTWIILRLFLSAEERRHPLHVAVDQWQLADKKGANIPLNRGPLTRREWYVLTITVGMVGLWATEGWHGINNVTVAILGSMLLTAPRIGVIGFPQAMKEVNWSLLLFMAASMIVSERLVAGESIPALLEGALVSLVDAASYPLTVVSVVAITALLSHLVINSRTARASVLVPLIVLFAQSLGYAPALLAIVAAAATGFCQTLPISAKPVAMFGQAGGETYRPADLLRLSMALLPLHLLLLLLFAFGVWPHLGLPLRPAVTPSQVDMPALASPVAFVVRSAPVAAVRSANPTGQDATPRTVALPPVASIVPTAPSESTVPTESPGVVTLPPAVDLAPQPDLPMMTEVSADLYTWARAVGQAQTSQWFAHGRALLGAIHGQPRVPYGLPIRASERNQAALLPTPTATLEPAEPVTAPVPVVAEPIAPSGALFLPVIAAIEPAPVLLVDSTVQRIAVSAQPSPVQHTTPTTNAPIVDDDDDDDDEGEGDD